MIEIRHLTKKYGNNVAVNDLNLTLEPGNIYGFLGPNGAGKSTTMNIITGYIGATEGEVLVNGYDINKEPEKAKQCIGYLPELPPLYGDMKVGEYLDFVADLKKLNRNTREADLRYVMNLTKISSMRNRLIRNLSKGYKQRVGLAQALMGLPEIIILDEPTVGLDPTQIIEIRELIKSLRDNHTVILSSHILQEISAVCDHVFIISNGNLVASDTMEHLEEEMSGAQQLAVTVRATREEAQQLRKIAGVKSVEILETITETAKQEKADSGKEKLISTEAEPAGDAADGEKPMQDIIPEIRLSITANPGCDVREDVFRHCVSNQIVLLEMSVVTRSLEDIFLELTDAKEVQ
ncbi:MAG: ABC transporter ATP-binding protein [Clostridiales bacterium]|nr:ABC transporter ATP-binding protein [Clostridiales bacterium]